MGRVSPKLFLLLLQCIYPTLDKCVFITLRPALNSLALRCVKEEMTGIIGWEIRVKSGSAICKHGHGYVKDECANTKYPQALNHESLAVMLPQASIALQGRTCHQPRASLIEDGFFLHWF